MSLRLRILLTMFVCALVAPGLAQAGGGTYVFDGGTAKERSAVHSALEASSFDWSLVPATITIHIKQGIPSEATRGNIWIDSDLLASGRFAWGVVQHEYAHQVDYFLLDDAKRAQLLAALGGSDWCGAVAGLDHAAYGCERWASTLAWAYWQSPDNSMRPTAAGDESAAMAPAKFRALLANLLGATRLLQKVRSR
jgi:hypothetical protein